MNKLKQSSPYVVIALLIVLATVLSKALQSRLDEVDLAMVYLLVIIYSGYRFSIRQVVFTVITCVVTYDFFIIPKYYSFDIEKLHHIVTLSVMVVIGFVVNAVN